MKIFILGVLASIFTYNAAFGMGEIKNTESQSFLSKSENDRDSDFSLRSASSHKDEELSLDLDVLEEEGFGGFPVTALVHCLSKCCRCCATEDDDQKE